MLDILGREGQVHHWQLKAMYTYLYFTRCERTKSLQLSTYQTQKRALHSCASNPHLLARFPFAPSLCLTILIHSISSTLPAMSSISHISVCSTVSWPAYTAHSFSFGIWSRDSITVLTDTRIRASIWASSWTGFGLDS